MTNTRIPAAQSKLCGNNRIYVDCLPHADKLQIGAAEKQANNSLNRLSDKSIIVEPAVFVKQKKRQSAKTKKGPASAGGANLCLRKRTIQNDTQE